MPVCAGCGGSFVSEFSFCPYCGRAKPEPDSIEIKHSVEIKDMGYEESKLVVKKIGQREVNEEPFDYRENIFDVLLDKGGGRNWKTINIYTLSLVPVVDASDDISYFDSSEFEAFPSGEKKESLKFPIPVRNSLVSGEHGRNWLYNFYRARKKAWSEINEYLIKNRWKGITEEAKDRTPPFVLHQDLGSENDPIMKRIDIEDRARGLLEKTGYLTLEGQSDGHFSGIYSAQIIPQEYRYQRGL